MRKASALGGFVVLGLSPSFVDWQQSPEKRWQILLFYGIGLLVVHGLIGNTAKVSLGSFPPLLAVITAIIGMFLGAAGGRLARMQRERQGIFITDEHIAR